MRLTDRPTVALLDRDRDLREDVRVRLKRLGVRVASFKTGPELLVTLEYRPFAALLLDLATPDLDALAAPRTLADRALAVPVIALAEAPTVERAVQALQAGVADLVEKPLRGAALAQAVERALGLHRRWVKNLREREAAKQRLGRLTRREHQILRLLAECKPNWQIAQELEVSPKTLDIHRLNLKRKLQARTTADVMRFHLLLHTDPLGLAYLGTASAEPDAPAAPTAERNGQ